jgi:hypothetical protein
VDYKEDKDSKVLEEKRVILDKKEDKVTLVLVDFEE